MVIVQRRRIVRVAQIARDGAGLRVQPVQALLRPNPDVAAPILENRVDRAVAEAVRRVLIQGEFRAIRVNFIHLAGIGDNPENAGAIFGHVDDEIVGKGIGIAGLAAIIGEGFAPLVEDRQAVRGHVAAEPKPAAPVIVNQRDFAVGLRGGEMREGFGAYVKFIHAVFRRAKPKNIGVVFVLNQGVHVIFMPAETVGVAGAIRIMGKPAGLLVEFVEAAAIRADPEDVRVRRVFNQPPHVAKRDALRIGRIRLKARKFPAAAVESVQPAASCAEPENRRIRAVLRNILHGVVAEAARIVRLVAVIREGFGRGVELMQAAGRADPKNIGLRPVCDDAPDTAVQQQVRPHAV